MAHTMYSLLQNKDYAGVKQALANNPALANEGIPFDEANPVKAHPLHRLCDRVFAKTYTEEEAVRMAEIFLEYGANVNGNNPTEKQDTPLVAAASLHADQLAFLYLDNGADIHHAGCHGGTALHWAAWCGRDQLLSRLLQEGADINKRCIDFNSTPLFWAVHGLKTGGSNNLHHQVECINLLLQNGADKSIPNGEGITAFDLLGDEDGELKALLTLN